MTVFVQDKCGNPLPPTKRCGHVRILLKENKAKVVCRRPFTILLLYDVSPKNERYILGIDPGRTNIGLAVINEKGEAVASVTVETRNHKIPGLMRDRAAYRRKHRSRGRRCVRQRRAIRAGTVLERGKIARLLPHFKKPVICNTIRNKESKFCNRRRPEGWLTPTANQLMETHVNLVKKMMSLVPITDVVLEVNKFAFMAMENPGIKRWQYQKGPLYGYDGVEEAIFEQQKGHCIFCNKPIEEYHHIVEVSEGGSESLLNRAGVCGGHHHLVHTDIVWKEALIEKKNGLNKKYGALGILNQIFPKLIRELEKLYPGHVYVTDGYSTKCFRDDHYIDKDHHLDAYCIACSVLEDPVVQPPEDSLKIMQFRRHDRMACHQENVDRKYLLDGEVVCKNRHKRKKQMTDSLEEFREKHGDAEVSRLTVFKQGPTYKDMDRIMGGAVMQYTPKLSKKDVAKGKVPYSIIFVMQKPDGKHNGKPDYYVSTEGRKYTASRCKLLRKNNGLVFV